MSQLSTKQQRILDFLATYTDEHSYPPSIREICSGCEISSTSVADYNLNALERKGFIRRHPEISRGIEVLGHPKRPVGVRVPVIGQIAAGEPIPVPENTTWTDDAMEDTIDVSPMLVRGKRNVFALRVKGDSMIDALINDGDIVVMEPRVEAEDGSMIAAWIKSRQETTLKKLYREGDRIRLQPANSTMEPMYFDRDDVEVQAKVMAVIRSL